MSELRQRAEAALRSPRARRAGLLAGWLVAGIAATLVASVVLSLLAGQKLSTIETDSQAPDLRSGDLIFQREVEPGEVESGEIITFSEPGTGRDLSHRVRQIDTLDGEVRIVTKGDSNQTFERFTVAGDGTVAVVVRRIPFAGHLADAVGGPIVLLFLGVALVGVAGGTALRRRRLLPGT